MFIGKILKGGGGMGLIEDEFNMAMEELRGEVIRRDLEEKYQPKLQKKPDFPLDQGDSFIKAVERLGHK